MPSPSQKEEWVREERRTIARDAINRAFDASMGLLKWVLTSVAAFHAAALIAGFNSDRFAAVMFAGPAWAFLGGIGLTLFSGILLSIGAAGYAGDLTGALWRGEGLDSETNDTYDPEPNWVVASGAALLGLSVAAFILGIGLAAYKIGQIPPAPIAIESSSK